MIKKALFKLASPVLDRVKIFENRHKGEACYLFGDGVSIKWFDLVAFPQKPSFLLNWFVFHKNMVDINKFYGVLPGPYSFFPYPLLPYIKPHPEVKRWYRNKIHRKYREVVKENPEASFFFNISDYLSISGSNIYFLFRSINDFGFANECHANSEGIYDGSFRCAIALAIYMGFTEIYLVGCDYTHENSKSLHWYEKGEGIFTPQPDYQRRYLEIASKYVKITTITLEGGGSVLPALTYTEFTGCPLSFRENYELTDTETLNLLATWPGYRIF